MRARRTQEIKLFNRCFMLNLLDEHASGVNGNAVLAINGWSGFFQ